MKTKYIGSCGDGECSQIFDDVVALALMRQWDNRIYNDEIPFPTEEFCWLRANQLCDYKQKWAWPAACAWNRLRLKLSDRSLTK